MSLDFDSARLNNSHLTAEHEEWRAQLRRFFDREVIPFADQWDEEGALPDELWPKAAAVGILGLGYPEEFGGVSEGIDIWHKNILNEEMARIAVGGLSATLMVHGIGLPPVLNFASEPSSRKLRHRFWRVLSEFLWRLPSREPVLMWRI